MAALTAFFLDNQLRIRWQLIIIVSLTLLSFLTKLDNELIGDDRDFITNWPAIQQVGSLPQLLTGDLPAAHQGNYRPVRSLLYLFYYQLSGTNTLGYHLHGLGVQVINSLLVYGIVRKLTSSKSYLPFFTGVLFSTHPIHLEAISFITASFDTTAFAFLFGSFYLYLGNKAHQQRWAILLYLLALGTNEITYIFPLLLVIYHYLFHPLSLRRLRSRIWPYVILLGIFLGIRFFGLDIETRGEYAGGSFYYTQLISVKAIVLYLKLLLVPVSLGLIHTLPGNISSYMFRDVNQPYVLAQSIFEPAVLVGLFLIGAAGGVAYGLRNKKPLISFGICWFFIALLPTLNLLPSAVYFSERYVYLASFGFILVLATVFEMMRTQSHRRIKLIAWSLFIGVVATYVGLSIYHNQFWQNEIVYWQKNVREAPDNFLAHYQLGQMYHYHYYLAEAIQSYQTAIAIEPSYTKSHHNLGLIQHHLGQYQQAIESYQQVLNKYPDNQTVHINQSLSYLALGQQQLRLGLYQPAEQNLHHAIRLNPDNRSAHQLLVQLCDRDDYTCLEN